ncbi:16S rRNA (guanine(527)-N(7))-methyltransferase RsmG [Sneathiella sp. P13V-1]|uniref:16S rRNA (guanine(527)-N(7))-methyltransferase RsmG n=1 Tax=Sneathiella sp. P13V-1 TaxID=2697366 RepID=UPI00187B5834|nr:16S rRNA (guanine(527)-N(7))-methyltransferase RsmG [Sneathiella sp. P13V-1]MBE7636085.1 16S rRNA (guanine(527)-N(7))-methyltransferase RsmG [Sneathiella sp. P13V-1]
MTEQEFASLTGVSRETLEKLSRYVALLKKWQKAINLVSNSTLSDAWRRHILDSYQILEHAPSNGKVWMDFGSGAGFPALVVAICSDYDVHVVESDQRKCQFMREVSRETSANITVHNCRIEEMQPLKADVISARALAYLEKLFEYCVPFSSPETTFLFLKGQDVDAELTNAAKCWNIDSIKHPSLSSEEGCILECRNVRPLD